MKHKKQSSVDVAEPKKSNIPLILSITGIILLTVLIIFIIIYFLGPKKAVKRYTKSGISAKGGKNYFSMILPDHVIDQLRSDEKWDDMIESYNTDTADFRDTYKYSVKNIEKRKKLSDDELDGAQIYFAELAEKYDAKPVELDIVKGVEFEITLNQKDRETKKKTANSLTVCAIKIKGQGWKIAELSAVELKKLTKSAD